MFHFCFLLKPKCAQYWPTVVGEEAKFEDFSVSLESETHPHFGFVMRNLVVTHEGSVRRVYQFHYTEWPDHGEPAGVEPLIDLVEMIKQCQGRDVQPIVVHCRYLHIYLLYTTIYVYTIDNNYLLC